MIVIMDVESSDDLDEAKKFYEDVADVAAKTSFKFLHLELRKDKDEKKKKKV